MAFTKPQSQHQEVSLGLHEEAEDRDMRPHKNFSKLFQYGRNSLPTVPEKLSVYGYLKTNIGQIQVFCLFTAVCMKVIDK